MIRRIGGLESLMRINQTDVIMIRRIGGLEIF